MCTSNKNPLFIVGPFGNLSSILGRLVRDVSREFFGDADAKQSAVVELLRIPAAGEAFEAREIRLSDLKDAKFRLALWCKDAKEARLHRDILNNRDPRGKASLAPNPHDKFPKPEKPGSPVKQLSTIMLVASMETVQVHPLLFRQANDAPIRVFGGNAFSHALGQALIPHVEGLKAQFIRGSVCGMQASVSNDLDFGSNDMLYWLHVPVVA